MVEYELLRGIDWIWTEKIDGTNVRVLWDGEKVSFLGKSDDASIPPHLLSVLQNQFTAEKLRTNDIAPCTLYGEGYGRKIQNGEWYKADGAGFVLFDAKFGDLFLERTSLENLAGKLDTLSVPLVGRMLIDEAILFVREGFPSRFGNGVAEGLVGVPAGDLLTRQGERIITKIKHRDMKSIQGL